MSTAGCAVGSGVWGTGWYPTYRTTGTGCPTNSGIVNVGGTMLSDAMYCSTVPICSCMPCIHSTSCLLCPSPVACYPIPYLPVSNQPSTPATSSAGTSCITVLGLGGLHSSYYLTTHCRKSSISSCIWASGRAGLTWINVVGDVDCGGGGVSDRTMVSWEGL